MPRVRADFPNVHGKRLSGLLELPNEPPQAFALFAHCFTCSKDVAAASRITRALTRNAIATLRFDFTGLGNSDGDFANTNFSSNVEDLVAAADWLAAEHHAPTLLVGHSLGGAAVLAGAGRINSARALVTIGAPATAHHVEHLFADARDEIASNATARVLLAGREFTIKRQFLEDLAQYADTAHIGRLGVPLLVCHSPVDAVVSIDEAARIYQAAKHPKSFVSLADADHLLTRAQDSEYVADVIAAWSRRYLAPRSRATEAPEDRAPQIPEGSIRVVATEGTFGTWIVTEKHRLLADEPEHLGGKDAGPNPYELLLGALGACTSMTIRLYAAHKKLALDDVTVTLRHTRRHADDCAECEGAGGFVEVIERWITLEGDLTPAERERCLAIADRCPVHRTLESNLRIETYDGVERPAANVLNEMPSTSA